MHGFGCRCQLGCTVCLLTAVCVRVLRDCVLARSRGVWMLHLCGLPLCFQALLIVFTWLLLLHAYSANGLVEETHARILNRHRGATMDFSCLGSCDKVVLHKHLELAKFPKAAHILGQR